MALTPETNYVLSMVIMAVGFSFVASVLFNLVSQNVIDWFNNIGSLD